MLYGIFIVEKTFSSPLLFPLPKTLISCYRYGNEKQKHGVINMTAHFKSGHNQPFLTQISLLWATVAKKKGLTSIMEDIKLMGVAGPAVASHDATLNRLEKELPGVQKGKSRYKENDKGQITLETDVVVKTGPDAKPLHGVLRTVDKQPRNPHASLLRHNLCLQDTPGILKSTYHDAPNQKGIPAEQTDMNFLHRFALDFHASCTSTMGEQRCTTARAGAARRPRVSR